MEYVNTKELDKGGREKSLTYWRKRSVGRNNQGRITTRHKGGGVKKLYREIDFLYDKIDVSARVERLEYDPNRSSFIALLVYRDGERRYVVAPATLRPGSVVISSVKAPIAVGNRTVLSRIPIGTFVYNVELERGRGGVLARSAGVGAIVMAQEDNTTTLQLPSGEVRRVQSGNWASIGTLSNPEHGFMTIGKAGRHRKMGVRPSVRGKAMNPRDHAHGGGEGNTQIGRAAPRTPWGKLARGVKTRRKNARSSVFILERRK